ncbi:isoprenylcysteine carboxylmethyltransferase family protein [Cryobacterium sp. BB736]|uniref:methyltransferase family protein n=1 Tax=Cryobacterium sp. BB736 TaxID=2746963 RepID=UPI00187436A7|nr:isoprenylcysteine carboxylmethyltransferase family protein [Cryobacterium sp. BB736]
MRRELAWSIVAAQVVLLAALALMPHGSLWPLHPAIVAVALLLGAAGIVLATLAAIRLGDALTPSPIPKQHTPLATTGVYGLMRNPIYTGIILVGAGMTLFGASTWHIGALVALLVLLAVKARWEERMLAATHPDYPAYARRVGRFLPRIGRLRGR